MVKAVGRPEFYKWGGDDRRYSLQSYLNTSSIVIEVGGYVGNDIKELFRRYGSFRTLIFEPVFYERAKLNFAEFPTVEVFSYGLGSAPRDLYFESKEASTKPSANGVGHQARIKHVAHVLSDLNIRHASLLQINCEGCEWEVLEAVLSMPSTSTVFEHIQVQFHPNISWVENALTRYAIIQDGLASRYSLVYDIPWVWQMWSL